MGRSQCQEPYAYNVFQESIRSCMSWVHCILIVLLIFGIGQMTAIVPRIFPPHNDYVVRLTQPNVFDSFRAPFAVHSDIYVAADTFTTHHVPILPQLASFESFGALLAAHPADKVMVLASLLPLQHHK